jgi:hypothetical protein
VRGNHARAVFACAATTPVQAQAIPKKGGSDNTQRDRSDYFRNQRIPGSWIVRLPVP